MKQRFLITVRIKDQKGEKFETKSTPAFFIEREENQPPFEIVSVDIYSGKEGEETIVHSKNVEESGFVLNEAEIKPCPEKCRMNWVQFHKDLDLALAHMIEEFDGFYPSKAKLWDLVKYSHKKSQMNEGGMKTVGEVLVSPQYKKRLEKAIKNGKK